MPGIDTSEWAGIWRCDLRNWDEMLPDERPEVDAVVLDWELAVSLFFDDGGFFPFPLS